MLMAMSVMDMPQFMFINKLIHLKIPDVISFDQLNDINEDKHQYAATVMKRRKRNKIHTDCALHEIEKL